LGEWQHRAKRARRLEVAAQRAVAHTQRRRLRAIVSAWQDLGEWQNSVEPEHTIDKPYIDNLRMITLNLDRDFDAWKPVDAQSLAEIVAKSAGVAKEHVKILDCQRGSVIASTVIMASDWSTASANLKTWLVDESGPLKDMGVVGCVGLPGGVVGKAPMPAAAAGAASAARAQWARRLGGAAQRRRVWAILSFWRECAAHRRTAARTAFRWSRRRHTFSKLFNGLLCLK